MNHNLLISKYLDGELSFDEDNELRRLLSESSAIKEDFDSATMLHFMMKDDSDSVQLPSDLYDQTESLILGRYSKVPIEDKPNKKANKSIITRTLGSAVVALLVLFVMPIGDTTISLYSTISATSDERPTESAVTNTLRKSSGFFGKTNPHNKLNIESSTTEQSIATNTYTSDLNSTTNTSYSHDGSFLETFNTTNTQNSLSNDSKFYSKNFSFYRGQSSITPETTSNNTISTIPVQQVSSITSTQIALQPLVITTKPFQDIVTDVQVNTFVSTMISLPGDYTNTTSTFSQSIAYAIGNDNRVGVEVGYFGYSYNDGGTVLIPRSNITGTSGKILGMDDPSPGSDDAIKERSSSSLSNGFDEKIVEYSLEKNMYWGAAFYEHTMLNTGNISLNGRVGLGGSNDGPMAFTRAYARYNVYSGIAVTLGAEANAFMIHAPMISGKQVDVTSGVSLVYGMQIKF